MSFANWKAAHPLATNALTMFFGTGAAQVIPFLTAPLIGRLYTPEDRAIFGYFLAFAAAFTTLAALRYEVTIVACKTNLQARVMTHTTLRLSLVASILVTLVAFLVAEPFEQVMKAPGLASLLPISGILVIATALMTIWGFWLNRHRRYRILAVNKVQVIAATAAFQIIPALCGWVGVVPLVIGYLLAQIGAAGLLGWGARDSHLRVEKESGELKDFETSKDTKSADILNDDRVSITSSELRRVRRELLHRYRNMPIFNLPNAVFDAIRLNIIPIMVGYWWGNYASGNFSYAWMLAQAPVVLISGAFSQVYYQHLASTPRGGLTREVDIILRRSLLIGSVPFLAVAVVSPWFFPFYLGDQWVLAGWVAAALTPWLYMNSVASPLSTVFVLTDQQAISMVFSFVFMLMPMATLGISHIWNWGLTAAITLTSLAMGIMLAFLLVIVRRAAAIYDRGVES